MFDPSQLSPSGHHRAVSALDRRSFQRHRSYWKLIFSWLIGFAGISLLCTKKRGLNIWNQPNSWDPSPSKEKSLESRTARLTAVWRDRDPSTYLNVNPFNLPRIRLLTISLPVASFCGLPTSSAPHIHGQPSGFVIQPIRLRGPDVLTRHVVA